MSLCVFNLNFSCVIVLSCMFHVCFILDLNFAVSQAFTVNIKDICKAPDFLKATVALQLSTAAVIVKTARQQCFGDIS